MGEAPKDLSIARGTTGLGGPGCYSFGKGTGQQGTETQGMEMGFGFAPPVFQNLGLVQATGSGAEETGAQGLWASLTAGTGMSSFGLAPLATGNQVLGTTSALGATASRGPGQWANPTTRTGISGFGLAQPATGNQGFGQATALGATATEKNVWYKAGRACGVGICSKWKTAASRGWNKILWRRMGGVPRGISHVVSSWWSPEPPVPPPPGLVLINSWVYSLR